MSKKRSPESIDALSCSLCQGVEGLDLSDFKKHRADVHNDPDIHHLKMRVSFHLDGEDWFSWAYEILDGQKVVGGRYVQQPRRGLDKAMWKGAG